MWNMCRVAVQFIFIYLATRATLWDVTLLPTRDLKGLERGHKLWFKLHCVCLIQLETLHRGITSVSPGDSHPPQQISFAGTICPATLHEKLQGTLFIKMATTYQYEGMFGIWFMFSDLSCHPFVNRHERMNISPDILLDSAFRLESLRNIYLIKNIHCAYKLLFVLF